MPTRVLESSGSASDRIGAKPFVRPLLADEGGDGEGGGGEEDEEDEDDELQIVKPDLVTEPSVYHDIVSPELMLTPSGPLVPA